MSISQIGTAVGVTVTTVVYNRVLQQDSLKMGVTLDVNRAMAPRQAMLNSYKAAQWTAFAFGILCEFEVSDFRCLG